MSEIGLVKICPSHVGGVAVLRFLLLVIEEGQIPAEICRAVRRQIVPGPQSDRRKQPPGSHESTKQ